MNILNYVSTHIDLPQRSIANTLKLLEEDSTVPFIARYRKEMTGNLDEVQISGIQKLKSAYEELEKRKASVLKSIEEQEELSPELKQKIESATSLTEVEDLYLPYKRKRNTRAGMAREKGLEPLAKMLMAQSGTDVENAANRFLNDKVGDTGEALQGAVDISAEWINENRRVRHVLRRLFSRSATISASVVKGREEDEQAQKYRQYFDWNEPLYKCPSHRLLAMLRAEKEEVVRVKVAVDKEQALEAIENIVIRNERAPGISYIRKAAKEAYERLLYPAVSNEILKEAKEKADHTAIQVFSGNLRQLLLAPPLGEKRILAIDPGFKSGCKVVCLDEKGDLLYNENIYPHPPQREASQAIKKIRSLVNAYRVEAIAIGNGTASRETEALIKRIAFDREVQVFVVNESGASVYSASGVARQEFPNYDVTVRGAVSIGRRLADPLAELVKIDPKSIGVGQYQHDVDQGRMKTELDAVVMSCVNSIGVNVNTASPSLLGYVSGIGPSLAEKIVEYRSENGEIRSRKELLMVPRLGNKAFEQSAAFLRILQGKNPLDNSAIHPESYTIVEKMARDLQLEVEELIGNKENIARIKPEKYCTDSVGLPTLNDILRELEKPGLDPRKKAKVFEFSKDLRTIEDVKPGITVPGIVNNITNFGCFVDIGIKESGLVHISRLSDTYVSDVNSVVKLHQHVMVKVIDVDLKRKRIQLSMTD
ncbi:Tex-like N-terminal domain-containing protein [Sinomicrobium weinanense]|uniref:RNA-binding transcriptional accessory protein n=1 Tax=Sinomicrobium weinanense TaxID=2842200 RepID=A0A926JTK6_9FLAO|nr:RNA-binding transcriptional accessory protein [Sinomicrobium weinanense]MBU3125428.1 RNA-binding transcriptional accessory protein [Sinomicrobium weinanense]